MALQLTPYFSRSAWPACEANGTPRRINRFTKADPGFGNGPEGAAPIEVVPLMLTEQRAQAHIQNEMSSVAHARRRAGPVDRRLSKGDLRSAGRRGQRPATNKCGQAAGEFTDPGRTGRAVLDGDPRECRARTLTTILGEAQSARVTRAGTPKRRSASTSNLRPKTRKVTNEPNASQVARNSEHVQKSELG